MRKKTGNKGLNEKGKKEGKRGTTGARESRKRKKKEAWKVCKEGELSPSVGVTRSRACRLPAAARQGEKTVGLAR